MYHSLIGNSKRHHITFRITSEEYSQLRAALQQAGARSMSDFARRAVLDRARVLESQRVFLVEDLATISSKLKDLDGFLFDLRTRISKVLGTGSNNGEGD